MRTLALILLFVLAPSAHAAPPDDANPGNDSDDADEIVVVAPPVIEGNRVERLASAITVVSDDQIEDLGAQDLPSALRRTPGVVISRHNPVGSFGGGDGGAVFIRGQGGSRPGAEILALVDGVPKFVSIWTHPLMDVLGVDSIESIEIHKGAEPVLFGNMAAGAISIRTKRQREAGFTTRFRVFGGSHETWGEIVEHGGRVNDLDYYLVQSYRSSRGHRDDADGEMLNVYARLGYRLDDAWDLTLVAIHTDNRAEDPGPEDGSAPSDGRFATNDLLGILTLSHEHEWGEGSLKFYADDGDIDWTDQDEVAGRDTLTDYRNYGLRVRETLRPWAEGEILVGVDFDFLGGEVDFRDPDPASEATFDRETWRIVSPHVAVSHRLGSYDGWYAIPSAGLRYSSHSEFGREVAPQVGLVAGFGGTEFHARYARGVNFPGLYVKVQNDVFLPGENLWDDLDAETIDHYEIGVSHVADDDLRMDLTLFMDKGRDRIVVSPPPPFPPVLDNLGGYETRGAEATVTFRPADGVSVFVGATYLDPEPRDLPYAPRWTAAAGVNVRCAPGLMLNVDAVLVDEQTVGSRARVKDTENANEVDGYFLLNAKISYDFDLGANGPRGRVDLAIENLTDTDYEHKVGYPMPGIGFLLGFSVRF